MSAFAELKIRNRYGLQVLAVKTGEIAGALGHHPYDEVVQRDNMVITK